jgi:hypothetical protein
MTKETPFYVVAQYIENTRTAIYNSFSKKDAIEKLENIANIFDSRINWVENGLPCKQLFYKDHILTFKVERHVVYGTIPTEEG